MALGDRSNSVAHTTQAEQQHGDGEPAAIHGDLVLPADQQSAEVPQPSEAPLDFVPQPIVVFARDHWASPLGLPVLGTPLGWDAHANTTTSKHTTKGATIIPAV